MESKVTNQAMVEIAYQWAKEYIQEMAVEATLFQLPWLV